MNIGMPAQQPLDLMTRGGKVVGCRGQTGEERAVVLTYRSCVTVVAVA